MKVSVVVPVYNAEEFIKETIESVLGQTFTDFELLLLDDGSTDQSVDIIRSFDDSRIKYVICEHDFIGTHRTGYKMAKGKYIAHLDHDDLMVKDRLQIQFDLLESNPGIAACGGYMQQFGKHTDMRLYPLNYVEILLNMIKWMAFANSTGFIRRDFLLKNNIQHSRGFSYAADYKFWTDIVKSGTIVNIPKTLNLYRTSDNQASVKYFPESYEASIRIQYEMLEFFLSLLKDHHHPLSIIDEKLIPSINDISKLGFPSQRSFFQFMYELIKEQMLKAISESSSLLSTTKQNSSLQ